MPKIGLKIWSTNLQYIPAVRELFSKKVFDYIELFAVPGSTDTLVAWQPLAIPYVLHAPHSFTGLNPSDANSRAANISLVGEVEKFFYALSPAFVIFHPGIDGDWQESVRQFRSFEESFPAMYAKVVIENKPAVGPRQERCLGASPQEMRRLLESTGRGFCLDFGHAICYSVTANKDWKEVLAQFVELGPSMYHLCDGFWEGRDAHEHLGAGKFDLPYLINLIDGDKHVSLETKKDHQDSLDDFVWDVQKLKEYAGCRQ